LIGDFPVNLDAGHVIELPVRVQADPLKMEEAAATIVFEVHALDNRNIAVHEKSRFIGRSR